MNTVVTSKEAILNVCRELIITQGWEAINIRTVAAACNVSVGSIYNYFNSKSDLIAATVESVWCDIFHYPDNQQDFDSFLDCVAQVFDSMKKGDEKYPGFFTLHSMNFMGKEKLSGMNPAFAIRLFCLGDRNSRWIFLSMERRKELAEPQPSHKNLSAVHFWEAEKY